MTDFCRLCQEDVKLETIEHIISHCPRLCNLRLRWLGIQYHDRLEDIPDCGVGNIIGNVTGISSERVSILDRVDKIR